MWRTASGHSCRRIGHPGALQDTITELISLSSSSLRLFLSPLQTYQRGVLVHGPSSRNAIQVEDHARHDEATEGLLTWGQESGFIEMDRIEGCISQYSPDKAIRTVVHIYTFIRENLPFKHFTYHSFFASLFFSLSFLLDVQGYGSHIKS